MQDFYMSLPSNTPGYTSRRENTSAHFRVQLPEEIRLPFDESWEVALVELQYPFSWFNINNTPIGGGAPGFEFQNEMEILFIKNHIQRLSIPPGNYQDIDAVTAQIFRLSRMIPTNGQDVYDASVDFWLEYDESIGRVVMNTSPKNNRVKGVSFSPHLQYMLGFRNQIVPATKPGKQIAKYPPDMRAGIDSLYIYCDIVQPQLVGNKREQLLRIVPAQGKYGDMIGHTFTAPHYIPVLNKQFSTVEISIKTDTDQPFAFQYGKSVLKLHFRKY